MNKNKFIQNIDPRFMLGIAHRGKLDLEHFENSINSFMHSIENNVAIEFDVHLTKDKEIVIIHDSTLDRVTGKEGIVEKLNYEEIKNNYKLLDNTTIITLDELLDLNNEKVPLVIELKAYEKNYFELGKRVYDKLKNRIKDHRKYMIISFDPRCLGPFKKLNINRQLLIAKKRFDVFKFRHFFESVDIESNLLDNKKVINYAKKHFLNTWTIDSFDLLNNNLHKANTFTFQDIDYKKVQEIILSKYKKEKSVGAVLFKKENNQILYLVEYMKQGHISLCKGHQEQGENDLETLEREVKEETDSKIKLIDGFKYEISYFPNIEAYKKVIFYLAEIISDNKLQDKHDDEVKKIELLSFEDALNKLTYQTDKDTLAKAHEYLA